MGRLREQGHLQTGGDAVSRCQSPECSALDSRFRGNDKTRECRDSSLPGELGGVPQPPRHPPRLGAQGVEGAS